MVLAAAVAHPVRPDIGVAAEAVHTEIAAALGHTEVAAADCVVVQGLVSAHLVFAVLCCLVIYVCRRASVFLHQLHHGL